tara:strand:+ start:359 stop:856 length:498 start_codon:yes stop_codon:yes gene_type:complete
MNLLYYPNEFLTKEVKDVDIKDPKIDLKDIKEKMTDIMLSKGGIGLSANQVGIDAKIFIMGDTKENISLIINPKVLQHTKDTVLELEGCLSFPNVYMKIRRPKEILAEYYDETLEQKRTHLKGYSTKVFLHEWDHLHGITFKDRASNMKWNMALKKAKKLEKKYA